MGVVVWLDEGETAGGVDLEGNGESGGLWEDGAAIDGNLDMVGGLEGLDAELVGIVEDDTAIGEGMGVDGGDGEDAGGGVNDGATGGEIVCGGAGRGGKDDAIGVVGIHVFLLAIDLEADEAGGAGFNDDIVEGVDRLTLGVGAGEDGELPGGEVTEEELGESGADQFGGEAGHKAEAAEVNPEDGGGVSGGGLDDTEEGAIAADDNAEIGLLEGVGGEGEGMVDGGGGAVGPGDGGQFGGELGGTRFVLVDDKSDVLHGRGVVRELRIFAEGWNRAGAVGWRSAGGPGRGTGTVRGGCSRFRCGGFWGNP